MTNPTHKPSYRFSFDMGTSSIGGAVFKDGQLVFTFVRIFPEGMDRTRGEKSLNQDRRIARSLRRQTYRRSRRKQHVLHCLQRMDLLPRSAQELAALFSQAPYALRAKGIDEKLEAHELGRALYHLAQRRGYKSNRKTESDKKEDGIVLSSINKLAQRIKDANCETLGQYFHTLDPHEQRIRSHYTNRIMYKREFDLLIERQRPHHPKALNPVDVKRLRDAVFHQRPLKIQKYLIGFCPFETDRKRAAAATLAAQEFRLWQNLNHLKITHPNQSARRLTTDERIQLAEALGTQAQMAWGKVRKLLELNENSHFNLEPVRKSGLLGNQTAAIVYKTIKKKAWKQLGSRERERLVFDLLNIEEPDVLFRRLTTHWGLTEDTAQTLMDKSPGFPRGTMHLSHKALRKITEQLKTTNAKGHGPTYNQACELAGYDFKAEPDIEIRPMLPFPGKAAKLDPKRPRLGGIGHDRRHRRTLGEHREEQTNDASRIGEIRNPLVTRALYQLRRVTNALIERFDTPKAIHIELARDLKLTPAQRQKVEKRNRENERKNEEARKFLENELQIPNPRRSDILKYKLWEEAKHHCPYCNRGISKYELFDSNDAQIEHIIPYSRCMDDSYSNKTIAHAHCNAKKGNNTPWEAYGEEAYEQILGNIKVLPYYKRKRFNPDFLKDEEGRKKDFVSQQLNETRYIARKASEYLKQLGCDVVILSGKTTALLRRAWELNNLLGNTGEKNRNDHRHHAVDAVVIGLTTHSAVQELSTTASFSNDRLRPGKIKIPPRHSDLRKQVAKLLNNMVVSHKTQHRVRGPLHEETLYSVTGETTEKGQPIVAVRKRLEDLDARKLHLIRDDRLREQALAHLALHDNNFKKAFQDENHPFRPETKNGPGHPVRHVRLKFSANTENIGSEERRNLRNVLTGNNHHIEIFEFEDTGRWSGKVVSNLEAMHRLKADQPIICKEHGQGRRFIMALHINDMLQLTLKDETHYWRVKKMDRNNNIVFQRHNDASDTKEPLKKTPNSLKALQPILLDVDPIGNIKKVRSCLVKKDRSEKVPG